MVTRKRWSKKEEKVLLDQIRKNPHNLNLAYIKTSQLLGRSVYACRDRWVKVLSKQAACFALIGEKMLVNGKQTKGRKPKRKPKAVRKSLWSKLKELLGL